VYTSGSIFCSLVACFCFSRFLGLAAVARRSLTGKFSPGPGPGLGPGFTRAFGLTFNGFLFFLFCNCAADMSTPSGGSDSGAHAFGLTSNGFLFFVFFRCADGACRRGDIAGGDINTPSGSSDSESAEGCSGNDGSGSGSGSGASSGSGIDCDDDSDGDNDNDDCG